MSQDDTGGFSLTNPAESASARELSGGWRIGTNSRTMTGNDPGGRSLVQAQVQAQVQAVVQAVARKRLPDRAAVGVAGIDAPLAGLCWSGTIEQTSAIGPIAVVVRAARSRNRYPLKSTWSFILAQALACRVDENDRVVVVGTRGVALGRVCVRPGITLAAPHRGCRRSHR